MPVTAVTALYILTHLIFSKYYYPSFTDEETKAQKD